MSQVRDDYTVCDGCGGAIPSGADRIAGVNGTLIVAQQAKGFANLDFCCSAHLAEWVVKQPQVTTPDPPYVAPPVPV